MTDSDIEWSCGQCGSKAPCGCQTDEQSLGEEIVGGLTELCDAVDKGVPLREAFVVRDVKLPSEPMTDDQAAKIRKRYEPSVIDDGDNCSYLTCAKCANCKVVVRVPFTRVWKQGDWCDACNVALADHARADVPALLDERKRLKAENAKIQQASNGMLRDWNRDRKAVEQLKA